VARNKGSLTKPSVRLLQSCTIFEGEDAYLGLEGGWHTTQSASCLAHTTITITDWDTLKKYRSMWSAALAPSELPPDDHALVPGSCCVALHVLKRFQDLARAHSTPNKFLNSLQSRSCQRNFSYEHSDLI
jgi:hypothetical protein